MLIKHIRIFLFAALLLPLNSFATEQFSLPFLQNLFKTYQRQQAYDYASQYLSQMEGNPYFDYLYGVSAIDTGHASQGVFALERVLLAFPEDHVSRLELARGYYILEEYARARQEFEIVMGSNPPKNVQGTTQQFLDKIRLKEARYLTTSNGYMEFGIGTDSNVNSSPTENAYITEYNFNPGSNSEGVGQNDNFLDLTASWQITHPVAPGWLANAAITGSIRQNDDWDQFDSLNTTLQLGITRLYKNSRYKADLTSQQYDLDGETFRNLNGLDLSWHYAVSQTINLTTSVQYADMEYPTRPNQDSDLISLNFGYSHTFASSLSPTIFANINFGSQSASLNTAQALYLAERDMIGLRLGTILGLSNKVALQLSAGYQTSSYAGKYDDLDTYKREDDHISGDLNLLWLFMRDWRLDAGLSYSDNRSNVKILGYDRTQVSLNLNYAF